MPKPVVRQTVEQPLHTSYRYIPLTKDQIAIVDADDYEFLSKFNWCASACLRTHGFYAVRLAKNAAGKWRNLKMEKFLFPPPPGMVVDHISRNTLDNRRGNLRHATQSQNRCNITINNSSSSFRGVRSDGWGQFRASVTFKGRQINAGTYPTIEEAARARDMKALQIQGEFAILNFPIS